MQEKKSGKLAAILLLVTFSVVAVEFANIPVNFDPTSSGANEAEVRREVPQGQIGQTVVADFADNTRALFLRQNIPQASNTFLQIGNGWPKSTAPTATACNEEPDVPGCKPLVTATGTWDRCTGSTSEYNVTMSAQTVMNRAPDTYTLQRKDGSDWTTLYSGPNTQRFVTLTENKEYRVRGSNAYGDGEFSAPFTLDSVCPLQASNPNLFAIIINCQGLNPWTDVQWSGAVTHPSDIYEVQKAPLGTSNWSTIYNGSAPDSCAMIGYSIGTAYRARIFSTVNISSDWVYVYLGNDCVGGGEM